MKECIIARMHSTQESSCERELAGLRECVWEHQDGLSQREPITFRV